MGSSNLHVKQRVEWRELAWTEPLPPERAIAALERLATAPELGPVTLELRATKHVARWLVATRPAQINDLKQILTTHLPVRVVTARRARTTMEAAARLAITGKSLTVSPERVSETVRAIYGLLASLQGKEQVAIQLILGRRIGPSHLATTQLPSWVDLILGRSPSQQRPTTPARGAKLAEQHGFSANLRLGVAGASTARSKYLLTQLLGTLRTLETGQSRMFLSAEQPDKFDAVARPWRWHLHLSSTELAGLTGWPIGELPLPLLGSIHPQKLAPVRVLVDTERTIGTLTAPGHDASLGIPIKDSAFHTYLLGPTGSGKSTVMLRLITADVEAGRGVMVLDPKGDLAHDVLARIPKRRQADVVVIDPTNADPVGFNPLAGPSRMAPVTADTLLGTLQELFKENWGIRTADVLSAALLTLARTPGANLLWLSPLLTDPSFRRKVLGASADQSDPLGTDAYWQQYDAKTASSQATEIAPVLNKLRQLILRPGLRAMLGQSAPNFDIGDLFSKKRIVIVNLNRGLLGADAARLLGTLLMGQLWSRLLARQSVPPTRRQIVSIYVDEVHDFIAGLPGDLADALAQARSLGGAFTLAHQYRAQLSPAMLQAVDANTRSKIIFGLSGTDASAVAKHAHRLETQDFLLLPKYQAYANVMQDGENTGWASIATKPPTASISDPADLYAASHQRYGVSAIDTEQAILAMMTPPLQTPSTASGSGTSGSIGRKKR